MRYIRIIHGGLPYFGHLLDDATVRLWDGAPWSGGQQTDRLIPIRNARLLAPVTPSKIVCVGRNYAAHAKELGNEVPEEPLLFLKPPSALIAHGDTVVLPEMSQRVEHEGELAVVIGSTLRHASLDEAAAAVFGTTCANDVTARDLQQRDRTFTRGKGFDTFCPCGPWIADDVAVGAEGLTVVTRVNGEVRQSGSTTEMIWSVPQLLQYISRIMTLVPGDLVCTGTPEGVGPLLAGDRVEVEVQGIGVLSNPVAAGPTPAP